MSANEPDDASADRMRLMLSLRQAGVTNALVLGALEQVPRAHFLPPASHELAWENVLHPLPHGETASKPSTVALILSLLDIEPGSTVLEIGAGSGYQTAALSLLARRVIALERWRDLAITARERLGALRLLNVHVHCADGWEGWPREGPFDRIVINAAIPGPEPWLAQLAEDGMLLAPYRSGPAQTLARFTPAGLRDETPVPSDSRFGALQHGLPDAG